MTAIEFLKSDECPNIKVAFKLDDFKFHIIAEIMEAYKEKQCDINGVSSSFKVGTYSLYKQGDSIYCHWSEGLKMVIEKDGVVIKLEGEEIKKLVGSLPRTIGGVY